jgi:hypothetical protein
VRLAKLTLEVSEAGVDERIYGHGRRRVVRARRVVALFPNLRIRALDLLEAAGRLRRSMVVVGWWIWTSCRYVVRSWSSVPPGVSPRIW